MRNSMSDKADREKPSSVMLHWSKAAHKSGVPLSSLKFSKRDH